ncbi:hypothetical protein TIFTF001_044002 [Ficus carica]|uniref:Retrotransposon gag domain-containing protein n=1 Tax=Ficus carica TaxID=3494 RepID=A0AA87Z0Z0_FICCA|nr:hypothetical protein TIFTF001_043991 [Ficus carica]GMN26417.1 hypothetical protein TIFTF001_043996 [Ficus carica]GMN26430.1 hypothetical protein TIFTF001_043997 [Ficus carica]GMN26468.1 hypothetical protein TIFTF001_044002 [Ficus carica]
MENIIAENQILKNQLMALNSQAAYSYYYNPYVGYSSGASAGGWRPAASYEQRGANEGTWRPATSYNPQGASAGGWQHATPYHQQCSRATYSPINPMQPLFASEDTPVVDERQAQPRQTAPGPSSRRQTTPIRRSTPELSQSSEDLFQPGTNGPHESLRAYIKRFSKAISEISGLDDGTAREALKKGLRHRSLFKNEICAQYPPTIQDALHRAKGFIELEEENERVERNLARTRDELSKTREERAKSFRRERPRPQRRTEHRVERTTRRDQKRPLSPPKYALGISPSELIAHLKRQDFVTWPKKLPENPARDTTKYCEFHRDHGHHTIDCRALRAEVAELLKKGHLREFLTDKGRESYGLGSEHKERRVVQQIEDTPSPPPVRKTIGVILGGSIYSGEIIVYSN